MKADLPTLFYLSTILVGAPALPSLRSLSTQREVAHIAYDEDNGQFLGFKRDGSLYGRYLADEPLLSRRSAGQCVNLTVAEAQSLPGWDALEAYAKSNWGSGSWNIVTNPADYPGSPAYVCVSDDPVKMELDGTPQCQNTTLDNVSKTSGADGTVSLQGQEGINMSSQYTVRSVSTLAISSTLGVSFGVPLLSADASVTVESDVTNEQSKSFETSSSNVATVIRTANTLNGTTCYVALNLYSCTAKSKGQIRYLATGWVWFNYNDKTKGHYKWAVDIESVLSNEDDRSSIAQIQGPISTGTHSTSDVVCGKS
ncbi:hypothetical protein F5146DRAFT_1140188 [Armillaria mellea]|nr:hypothetical protein F5146DRAFT_1140188 [Armillaria mellea]